MENHARTHIVFVSTPGNSGRMTVDLLRAIEEAGPVQVVKHSAMGKAESTRAAPMAAERLPVPLHFDHPAWFSNGKRTAQWKQEQGPQRRGKRGRR